MSSFDNLELDSSEPPPPGDEEPAPPGEEEPAPPGEEDQNEQIKKPTTDNKQVEHVENRKSPVLWSRSEIFDDHPDEIELDYMNNLSDQEFICLSEAAASPRSEDGSTRAQGIPNIVAEPGENQKNAVTNEQENTSSHSRSPRNAETASRRSKSPSRVRPERASRRSPRRRSGPYRDLRDKIQPSHRARIEPPLRSPSPRHRRERSPLRRTRSPRSSRYSRSPRSRRYSRSPRSKRLSRSPRRDRRSSRDNLVGLSTKKWNQSTDAFLQSIHSRGDRSRSRTRRRSRSPEQQRRPRSPTPNLEVKDSDDVVPKGKYLTVAFDAFVWTEESTRIDHLCQLGACHSYSEFFSRWILPPLPSSPSSNKQPFPFFECPDGYGFRISPTYSQPVDSFVGTRKGLEEFIAFLEKGFNKMLPDCDGIILVCFKRNLIRALILSLIDHEDLKIRFANIVKGIGDLHSYLYECPLLHEKASSIAMLEQSLSSVHAAARFIFDEVPPSFGQCDENSQILLNILTRLQGSCQPPHSFVRWYFVPLKSLIIRELILYQTLSQKMAKLIPLQQYVAKSLLEKELHLRHTGVILDLAPENLPGPLSKRLACGLVRALLASSCDFDSMLNTFGNHGALGLEAYLKESFLPNIINRQPEAAYEQTIEMCKLIVSFYGYYMKEQQQRQYPTRSEQHPKRPEQQLIQYPNKSEHQQMQYPNKSEPQQMQHPNKSKQQEMQYSNRSGQQEMQYPNRSGQQEIRYPNRPGQQQIQYPNRSGQQQIQYPNRSGQQQIQYPNRSGQDEMEYPNKLGQDEMQYPNRSGQDEMQYPIKGGQQQMQYPNRSGQQLIQYPNRSGQQQIQYPNRSGQQQIQYPNRPGQQLIQYPNRSGQQQIQYPNRPGQQQIQYPNRPGQQEMQHPNRSGYEQSSYIDNSNNKNNGLPIF